MPINPLLLSRRRFLRGTGAAAIAAFLASCGLPTKDPDGHVPATTQGRSLSTSTWTPTPDATPTPPPSSTPFASDVAGGPFGSPLDSPLVPTATPMPPTVTPTPAPTPFPAGPPSKLGLFVARYHPQIMDLVATGNVSLLKTMEFDSAFLADVKARSPQTRIIGRVLLDQIDLNREDMAAEARRAVDAVLPLALDEGRLGLVDAWEGHNEPVAGDDAQMRKWAALEVERVRLLAQHGLRAVVGNFGAGQPPLEWWPAFRPALQAAQENGGYLGLHEYSAPTIWYNTNRAALDFRTDPADEGWLVLRHRKVYRQFLRPWGLRLPLLITELGIDGQVRDRPGPSGMGWKDFAGYWAELGMGPDAAGNYIEQLAWYDSQMQLDDYVQGAAVFAMTAFEEWQSYELHGEAAEILQQYLSVHPVP